MQINSHIFTLLLSHLCWSVILARWHYSPVTRCNYRMFTKPNNRAVKHPLSQTFIRQERLNRNGGDLDQCNVSLARSLRLSSVLYCNLKQEEKHNWILRSKNQFGSGKRFSALQCCLKWTLSRCCPHRPGLRHGVSRNAQFRIAAHWRNSFNIGGVSGDPALCRSSRKDRVCAAQFPSPRLNLWCQRITDRG